jgi:hypothetical protein
MLTSRDKFWPLAVVVFLIALALYVHTWNYGYTCLDDVIIIVDKAHLLEKPSSLLTAFTQRYYIDLSKLYYRPLVNLSFAIDAQLGGTRPFVYHVTNSWLHALACVLVFAWMRRLRVGNGPAVAAAIFFAVHPIHVASVAWLAGRNDLLLGCFALGALVLLTRYLERPGLLAKGGHILCFLGALFSKETAVCLPIAFTVLVFAQPRRRRMVEYGWLAVGWGTAVIACFWVRSAFVVVPPGYGVKLLHTAWGARDILLADIGKLLLPVRLQVLAAHEDIVIWPGVVGAGLIVLVVAARPMRPRIKLLAGTVLVLPMLMALLASETVILENRLYLAVVGVSLLVGELLRVILAHRARWVAPAYATLCGVSLLMAVTTLRHTRPYRDCETFSRAAMAASPSSFLAKWLYSAHSTTGKKTTGLSTGEEMVAYGTVIMPLSRFRSMHRMSGVRTTRQTSVNRP